MNIGIVTTWFERGAAYVSRQFEEVLSKGHNVFIYARGGSYAKNDPAWGRENVTWDRFPELTLQYGVHLAGLRQWIKDNQIAMVVFNEERFWKPVLLCHQLGIITGAYIDYYTEETVPLFGCYDFLICNTKRHYSVFSWHPQVFYVPWGTDVNLFKPAQAALDKLIDPGVVTFFHSAGFSPFRKGSDFVINAFYQVKGPAKLVIHAQTLLEEHMPLQKVVAELKDQGRLEYYHDTVPAPGLYHKGDVYVYPSRLDGIGLTVAEALACGLPVITTDNPPMSEFVRHGETGRLVSVDRFISRSDGYYWPQSIVNEGSLIEQMQWFVDNMDEIVEYKNNARISAVREFNWELNSDVLLDVVKKVKVRGKSARTEALLAAKLYDRSRPLQKLYSMIKPFYYVVKKIEWCVRMLAGGRS